MKKLPKKQLEENIKTYIDIFCRKHGIKFNGWVGGQSGTIGLFNDYYFDFENIRLDLETNQPEDRIFKWYDYDLEADEHINYYSWIKMNKNGNNKGN